jgi:hypothetical protein
MDIFRMQTEQEKNVVAGGFKDVRSWRTYDPKQKALVKIAEVETEYVRKKRQPYCTKCAISMVDDKIEQIEKEIKHAQLSKKINELSINFDLDYDKFGGLSQFEEVDETEIEEDKLIDGIRQTVVTGKFRNFVCKKCGGHHSMEFKNREVDTNKLKQK